MQALGRLIISLILFPTERRPRRPLICRNGNGIVTGTKMIYYGYAVFMGLVIFGSLYLYLHQH